MCEKNQKISSGNTTIMIGSTKFLMAKRDKVIGRSAMLYKVDPDQNPDLQGKQTFDF